MTDRNNIERLFKDNYDGLCMYSLHYVGDIGMAEDIVMDCFLKLSEFLENSRHIISLKQYIYQMVRNKSLDFVRESHNTVQMSTKIDEIDECLAESGQDWEEVVSRSEREAKLWKAIDQLPTMRRKVLLMSKRDEMSNNEIAKRLGISTRTVESHLYKAYLALRRKTQKILVMLML